MSEAEKSKRWTVRIAMVEVDEKGEVVAEVYGCRLDKASTNYGEVDDLTTYLIGEGEAGWGNIVGDGSSSPRNPDFDEEGEE